MYTFLSKWSSNCPRHAKIGLPPEPTSTSLRHPLQHCTTIPYESIWIHTSFCDGTASERIGVSFQIHHICRKGFQLGQPRTFREFRLWRWFGAVQCNVMHKTLVKWINMAFKDEGVESPEHLQKRSWGFKTRPLAFRDATWIDELSHIITIFNP